MSRAMHVLRWAGEDPDPRVRVLGSFDVETARCELLLEQSETGAWEHAGRVLLARGDQVVLRGEGVGDNVATMAALKQAALHLLSLFCPRCEHLRTASGHCYRCHPFQSPAPADPAGEAGARPCGPGTNDPPR